jgi:hypothetical protein
VFDLQPLNTTKRKANDMNTQYQGNEAINTLRSIAELIGNVDHSKGNGGNAAKMRGELLNDIRTMALAVLEPAATSPARQKPKSVGAGQ